jgi:metal-responsive CopG/Arc/MetJ family transcriptional regulator
VRTLVDIPEEQLKELTLMSKERKTSRAALVREAVSAYIKSNTEAARLARIEAAFGIWKDRGMDAMDYLDALRTEWDR